MHAILGSRRLIVQFNVQQILLILFAPVMVFATMASRERANANVRLAMELQTVPSCVPVVLWHRATRKGRATARLCVPVTSTGTDLAVRTVIQDTEAQTVNFRVSTVEPLLASQVSVFALDFGLGLLVTARAQVSLLHRS